MDAIASANITAWRSDPCRIDNPYPIHLTFTSLVVTKKEGLLLGKPNRKKRAGRSMDTVTHYFQCHPMLYWSLKGKISNTDRVLT
jgi:hypothetical protein